MLVSAVEWPFVGRSTERRDCSLLLADMRSVLVAGRAGVGKTLLARTVADQAEADGLRVRRAIASATTELPRLAGDDAPDLLVVDDVDLLDADNATLVHGFVARGGGRLVATLRSHEGRALPAPLAPLWQSGTLHRIDLSPLRRDETDALLDHVLRAPIEASTRRRVWDLTLGSPLFLRELLNAAVRSGSMQHDRGMWRLDRSVVSPALDELIEQRVTQADRDAQAVVELVALGEPIGLEPLLGVFDADAVSAAEESGLISVIVDDRRTDVRLAHPIYGDIVRRRLPAARAIERCKQLLAMTETTPMRRRSDIVRAASWQLRAGGTVVSNDMIIAARRALYDQDDHLALEFARRASDADPVAAAIVQSEALTNVGEHHRAERLLRELGGTASESQAALIANQRAIVLFWGMGSLADALSVLTSAEATLPAGAWRSELVAERAVLLAMSGDARGALVLADPLLDHESTRVRVTAAIAASVAMGLGHRGADAAALSQGSQAMSAELVEEPMISSPAIHVVAEALALSETGEFTRADELSDTARAFSVAAGSNEGQAWCALVLGRVRLASGQLSGAQEAFAEASGAFARLRSDGPRRWAVAGQVLVAAARGDREALDEGWAALTAIRDHPAAVMETEVRRAAAWRARLLGDRAGAATLLDEAAEDAARRGQDGLAAAALHDVIRLDLVDGHFDIARWDALASRRANSASPDDGSRTPSSTGRAPTRSRPPTRSPRWARHCSLPRRRRSLRHSSSPRATVDVRRWHSADWATSVGASTTTGS